MNTYLPLRTHSYRISSTWTEFSWIYFAVLFDFFLCPFTWSSGHCTMQFAIMGMAMFKSSIWVREASLGSAVRVNKISQLTILEEPTIQGV